MAELQVTLHPPHACTQLALVNIHRYIHIPLHTYLFTHTHTHTHTCTCYGVHTCTQSGAIACGIYATNSSEACYYIANDCNINIAIAENKAQVAKFLQVSTRNHHHCMSRMKREWRCLV